MVGAHLRHRARGAALAAAAEVGREVGLGDMLDRPADTLTVAGRKRLELARALATEPKLLLLDEVLAGLNPSEIRDIVPVIRGLCDRGITIVMIEHVMQAVMSLSEHVFVLAEGRIIAEGTPAEVAADPAVVEAYLGHGAAAKLGRAWPLSTARRDQGLCAGYGETEVLRGVDLSVSPARSSPCSAPTASANRRSIARSPAS